MSNTPEVVNYKPVIYLASKNNIDSIQELFNNKVLQQEIKLVAEHISQKNSSSSSNIGRGVEEKISLDPKVALFGSLLGVTATIGFAGLGFTASLIVVALLASALAGNTVAAINDLADLLAYLISRENPRLANNRKLSDNNNINLLEQNFQIVPYSSVSETLIFPPGHPMPNKVYRQHPLPDKKNYYMPNDYYYKILLEEKEAELMKILCDLGANKIEIHEEENSLNSTIFEAETKVTSVAKTEAAISKDNENSQLNKREFSYIGKPWHSNLKDEFESSKYRWLHYEPTWESIVHGRLTNGQLMANIELTTTLSKEEMIGISLGITLEKVFLENLGLSASILDANFITKKRIFYIEFPGKE